MAEFRKYFRDDLPDWSSRVYHKGMQTEEVTAAFIAALKRIMSERVPPWTQRELAKVVGVSETNISRLLSGRTFPNRESMAQLCTALGVEPHELLLTEKPKSRKPKKK